MPSTYASLRPSVRADGTKLSMEQHSVLTSMRVTNGLGTPAHARLTFTVTKESPTISVKLGNALEISVDGLKDEADHDVDWKLFDGVVVSTGLELATGTTQTVVVEAYDKLYVLGRATVAKAHLEKTPTDIVRELAQSAGLTTEITGSLSAAGQSVAAYQYATAYNYIDRIVRDDGSEWFVTGDTLHIRPRESADAPAVKLTVGENLLEFSARFSGVDHVEKVTVTGWDVTAKRSIIGNATSSGTPAGTSNSALTSAAVKRSGIGGTQSLTIPRPVADQAEAERLAKGIVRRRESDMLRARGRAIPDEGIVPGAKLTIEGMVGDWDGTYYCTEVEHVWGTASFDTYFEVGASEPDSLVDLLGSSSGSPLDRMLGGLTIGVVTDNNDPDNLNRVKLKLPYLAEDQQTGWARVLQPGAGAKRGWNVLPEIDDEVLVGFEHGDIDRPYVLGGLVNGVDKPPYLNNGGLLDNGKVVARTFTSSLGHEIYVADGSSGADQHIKLVTADKHATLFLGAEKIDLQAEGIPVKVFNDQGSMEIAKNGDITMTTNGNITLKATKDVKIEGANVSVKANMGAKVEAGTEPGLKGNATSKLEASGPVVIKGAIVQVN